MTSEHSSPAFTRAKRRVLPHLRQLVASGEARCIDCSRPIQPGEKWAVGHIVAVAVARAQGWPDEAIHSADNLGPTHHGTGKGRNCNTSAGGKLPHQLRQAARADNERLPKW
jgi:hypothetical protein